MSTEAVSAHQPNLVEAPLTMKDLASLLVKHYGLRDGKFDLMIEYQLAAGAVGPDKDHVLPGVMIGIAKVGLISTNQDGPMTVDASLVNPRPKARKAS